MFAVNGGAGSCYHAGMTKLTVVLGDITLQDTEAIVNAANPSLLGGGGVDGAIHAAAGERLLEETRKLGGCAVGQAKITNGYDLPNDYVIHTVGPLYGQSHGREAELLAACYRGSLDLAAAHLIHSIAFPAIATGAYGYPMGEAASIAVATVRTWVTEHPNTLTEVRFVLRDAAHLDCYRRLLAAP